MFGGGPRYNPAPPPSRRRYDSNGRISYR
jgi:hypothetical protein